MTVRNFWIEGKVDGRDTYLTGGPRAKDGGFHLRIYARDRGQIKQAAYVSGWVDQSGVLHFTVYNGKEDLVISQSYSRD